MARTAAHARQGPGVPLSRRGTRFGTGVEPRRPPLTAAAAVNLWGAASPVHLRRAALPAARFHAADVAATVKMFTRLRRGAEFRVELARRLRNPAFGLAGSTVDLADPREIEKVHGDLRDVKTGRILARDLYAKLSWIARDTLDDSLRVRFSFGSERLRDWQRDDRRSRAADAFAEALFPECAALARNDLVLRLVKAWTGGPVRVSERILYANAPGGGAVFHHDAEARQLGVAYAQLAGETGWLALRKRDLAEAAARRLRRSASAVLTALDGPRDAKLDALLTRSAPFVADLVRAGHFYRVRRGDVLLLPSHGPDDVAWHSVFALGVKPSFALSFGIFRDRGRS